VIRAAVPDDAPAVAELIRASAGLIRCCESLGARPVNGWTRYRWVRPA
jgi:hypothetical protein